MKKVILLALAAAMLLSFSGCSGAYDTTPSSASSSGSTSSSSSSSSASTSPNSSVSSQIDEGSVDNTLQGLEKYLTGKGVIQGTSTQMDASYIGAKNGDKYKYSYEGKDNVTVELYEYDTSSLNDTANKVINSVKKDGKFTILEHDVKATISDNGKYLMIYTDTANGEKNTAHQTDAEKIFKAFKK